ncbi:hypothetical protein KSP39_PZI016692 [Platanthera zijinensis]|uniref:Ferredoxin thioredoxin reductase alpha chain domain-containing protein n=1 Tax=Platanthera zijinensis TaxID=2320716 RepID=A0AAP0G0B0_9ASPA
MLNKMQTAASTTSASALGPSLFRRLTASLPPRAAAPPRHLAAATAASARRNFTLQVAFTTDVDSIAEEEAEAAGKIGARIRVSTSVKVYHVSKAPELDLGGMEGTIKQYIGVWKGNRISANLPFKVEFLLPVDGQEKPVKFVAHLKEDEFEYLPESD